jgi:hypothetical protein
MWHFCSIWILPELHQDSLGQVLGDQACEEYLDTVRTPVIFSRSGLDSVSRPSVEGRSIVKFNSKTSSSLESNLTRLSLGLVTSFARDRIVVIPSKYWFKEFMLEFI